MAIQTIKKEKKSWKPKYEIPAVYFEAVGREIRELGSKPKQIELNDLPADDLNSKSTQTEEFFRQPIESRGWKVGIHGQADKGAKL